MYLRQERDFLSTIGKLSVEEIIIDVVDLRKYCSRWLGIFVRWIN